MTRRRWFLYVQQPQRFFCSFCRNHGSTMRNGLFTDFLLTAGFSVVCECRGNLPLNTAGERSNPSNWFWRRSRAADKQWEWLLWACSGFSWQLQHSIYRLCHKPAALFMQQPWVRSCWWILHFLPVNIVSGVELAAPLFTKMIGLVHGLQDSWYVKSSIPVWDNTFICTHGFLTKPCERCEISRIRHKLWDIYKTRERTMLNEE